MNAYLDSSVLIRVALGERDQLGSWDKINVAVASEILRVECLRTLDRVQLEASFSDEVVSLRRGAVLDAIGSINLVPLDRSILDRAGEPFPTQLKTLDAIHLASALLVREQFDELIFATHDRALGIAARSMGFEVQGI